MAGQACSRRAQLHAGAILLFFLFITLGVELSDTQVCEPSIRALLGMLFISAKQLFLNRELYLAVQHSAGAILRPSIRLEGVGCDKGVGFDKGVG